MTENSYRNSLAHMPARKQDGLKTTAKKMNR